MAKTDSALIERDTRPIHFGEGPVRVLTVKFQPNTDFAELLAIARKFHELSLSGRIDAHWSEIP